MRVEHVMHSGDAAPIVPVSTAMNDVIHEMSSKRLGMTCVVDANGGWPVSSPTATCGGRWSGRRTFSS